MTLRLRRTRRPAGVSGNPNATRVSQLGTGFDAGTNASKNNVAGRSQKSIAALSICTIPLSWDRTGERMLAIAAARHPCAYGVASICTGNIFSVPGLTRPRVSPVIVHHPLHWRDGAYSSPDPMPRTARALLRSRLPWHRGSGKHSAIDNEFRAGHIV